MKTLTQVVLPVAALAGLVFGITYVMNFSAEDRQKPNPGSQVAAPGETLKFWAMVGQRQPDPKSKLWFQKHWQDNFELGEDGHYDFWFCNYNAQPVRLAFTTANCQCASADLFVVPADAVSRYTATLTASSWPMTGGPVLAAVNAVQLKSALQRTHLYRDGKRQEGSVPAASADGPQMGFLRLNWNAKEPEGDHTVSAQFVAQVAGGPPAPLSFESKFLVAPPFSVYSPSSRGKLVQLGEIGPHGRSSRDFYVWSRTRPAMELTLTPQMRDEDKECVQVGKPVPLTGREIASLTGENPEAVGAYSAYRVPVSVQERVEVGTGEKKQTKQLDLGPIDFQIKVSAEEGKAIDVPVRGLVRGDIRLVGGQQADRIEFVNSFPSSESRTATVTLMAEAGDVRLELDRDACVPDYLRDEITLKEEPPQGGKKFWTLRVTIPANRLFGDLKGAYVVLKTGDSQGRRLRLPIRATTFDGPRI